MAEKTVLTQEALQALKEELHTLETVERKYVEQALAEARALGDLSENLEYELACDEQDRLENRIRELRQLLEQAGVV